MRKLTKIVIPALMAAGLLGAAGTASAQHYDHDRGHWDRNDWDRGGWDRDRWDRDDRYGRHYRPSGRADSIRVVIDNLHNRIERGDRRDDISRREYESLRRELWSIRQQFRHFNRDYLSEREFRILRHRLDRLRSRFHHERSDHDGHRW